jgi:hypothetical protein
VKKRDVFKIWVVEALRRAGGRGTQLSVAKHIWMSHEQELRDMDDVFFTWQCDFRWAATSLRKAGTLRGAVDSPRGIRELTEHGTA